MHELTVKLRPAAIALLCAGALVLVPSVAQAQFGITSFSASASTRQAGAHADLSSSFALNTEALGNPVGQLKSATVALPPGVVGNPQAIERCSVKSFQRLECQPGAQVGVLDASFIVCRGVSAALESAAEAGETVVTVSSTAGFCAAEPNNTLTIGTGASAEAVRIAYVLSPTTLELTAPLEHTHPAGEMATHTAEAVAVPIPLFNLQPTPGHVATFGASLLVATILVQVNVRSEGEAGLTATISDISTMLTLQASTLTLWGVPAEASHDQFRCDQFGSDCGLAGAQPTPFMTNPSDCTGPPLETSLEVTSWQGQSAAGTTTLPRPTGCERLSMSPSLSVSPDTTRRDTPAGYEIDLKVPQQEEPYELATPDLRSIAVTLPPGTSLSPAIANGLQACTRSQFVEGNCPNASKVGTAEITTPLLSAHLTGAVYVGTPTPTEKYPIFVSASGDSATVNLFGQVEPSASTGQVTAAFENAPQLPFSDFKLNLYGGPTAALANPPTCGAARSISQIASYGAQTVSGSSTFTVEGDGEESGCASSLPFTPSFSAGTTNPMAASFSPFTLTVAREDGQQNLSAFTAQFPPGLVGLLKTVPLCPEPQASEGACAQASEVGTATIGAGAGPQPLYVSGRVYLTGPYGGAPFGLAIVVDAAAGPYNLGNVVVRSRINVDPTSLDLTIASEPFPQILSGIPLRLRTVNVTLNRPGFIVNPTSCSPQVVSATVSASQGANAAVSSPFQVNGCAGLRFAPRLTAATQAKAGRRGDGASLNITLANPAGPTASMHSVVIELPAQLRPRLSTIQHACLSSTVQVSAASCPTESLVGLATVSTPVMSAPLTGGIYLVAHGGTALPSLVLLLHGEGIDVELQGTLSISRTGAISAAFRALPDVPIGSFDLALTRGPHSILGAIEGLCSKSLALRYIFTDQSGAQLRGATPIAVSGCSKRAAKKRSIQRAAKKGSTDGTHGRKA
jgi:hypothetical protein